MVKLGTKWLDKIRIQFFAKVRNLTRPLRQCEANQRQSQAFFDILHRVWQSLQKELMVQQLSLTRNETTKTMKLHWKIFLKNKFSHFNILNFFA